MAYLIKENNFASGDVKIEELKQQGYVEVTKEEYELRLNSLLEEQKRIEENQKQIFISELATHNITIEEYEEKVFSGEYTYNNGEFIKVEQVEGE